MQLPHAPGSSAWRRPAAIAGTWCAWAPLFVAVYHASGMIASATVMFPLVVTGWLGRARGAVIGSVLSAPFLAAMFQAVGENGWQVVRGQWPGAVAGFVVAGMAAVASELMARVGVQAGALAAERQALVAEVAARQRAQEELRRSRDELDRRVEERTSDLARANEELRVQIAERERIETELSRKEEHESQVLRLAPIVLYRVQTDDDAHAVWMGGRVELLTGFPADRFLNDALFWSSRLHPEDRERVQNECLGLLDSRPLSTEYRFRCADGQYRWLHDEAIPVPGGNGRHPEAFGVWFDVTARRAAQDDLRYVSAHAGCLLWHAHVREKADEPNGFAWSIHVFDEEAAQRFVVLDVAPGEAYADAWWRSRPSEDRARCNQTTREALRAGVTGYRQEFRCRRRDGEIRWISEQAHVEALGPGDFRVAGVATDITDLKQAQDALAQSEARYRLLTENAQDIIYRFRMTPVQGFEYVSPACTRITGYTPEEFYADPLLPHRIAHPDERHEVDVERLAEALEHVPIVGRMIRKDGQTIWLEQRVVRVLDDAGSVVAIEGIIRDITERRQLQERVQHAQKLESLGVLAGGIAHDFNNILTGILGNAGLAQGILPPGAPAQEYLEHIQDAALHAANLTNQMLAYSGKGRFVLRHIDLSVLVRDVLGLIRAAVSKKAVMKLDLASEAVVLEGDTAQIQQVIMNLVINASDALGEGHGEVTVRTGHVTADRDALARMYLGDDLAEGRYVFVEVADTGSGMDGETQSRIFDPFFTTKFTGRGLGLAAVLGIVRGHQGAIKVYSEVGKGSLFRVLFPSVAVAAPKPGAAAVDDREWRGSGTALVADDEACVRESVGAILKRAGFAVLLAEDGQEAIDLYQAHAGEVRVVVLDMTMPRLSGDGVARRLREADPRLPILFTSGFTEEEVAGHVDGAVAFIQKPYTAADLRRKVRRLLEVG